MGLDVLTKLQAEGITLSTDGGNLVATPKAALTDELRSLIRANKSQILAALAHPDLVGAPIPGVSYEFAARLSSEDWKDLAAGDITAEQVQAFEKASKERTTRPPDLPLTRAQEVRRQRVLAIQARDGTHYAMLVEYAGSDPVITALATPDRTCEVLIPKDRYDPFAVLEMVKSWEA
jgi:hypothetical protein